MHFNLDLDVSLPVLVLCPELADIAEIVILKDSRIFCCYSIDLSTGWLAKSKVL